MSNSHRGRRGWDRWLGRRRFVIGGVTTGAGLAALACAPAAAPAPAAVAPTSAPAAAAPAAAPVPTDTPQGGAPKLGGTLKFGCTGETSTLDPHNTQSTLLLTQGPGVAYARLVTPTSGPQRKADELVVVGDMAEKWDQPDDSTYILKLRPGVKWQNIAPVNGRELVADDIKYSFERQVGMKINASYLPNGAKFDVVDKQTLKISLPKPDADFLATLSDYHNIIVAKEAVDLKGDLKEGPTIGSGPWIHVDWTPNSVARVKNNPDYYQKGLPYLDALEFPRINDDQVKLAAFRAQELGRAMPGLTGKDINTLKQQFPQLVTGQYKLIANGLEMGYDQTKSPFNDKRVRQAFQMAVDRQQIIETAFDGAGWFSTMLKVPDFSYVVPEDELKTKWFKRDVAAAKQLLAAAGVQTPFEVELYHLQFVQNWTAAAELTIAQLKEIGVNARLKVVDTTIWSTQQAGQGEYQAYHGAILAGSSANADLYQRYYSGGSRNPTKTKDPQLDRMIDAQAVMARDPDGRKKALLDIQRYLLDQAYATSIWSYVSFYANWPWMHGYRVIVQNTGDHEPLTWVWLDK
jgi:peptide/nickel transport system substrate-binding protein